MSCCASPAGTEWLKPQSCFERGVRTRRMPALSATGEQITAASGLWAAFSFSIQADRLQDVRFTASSCTTLIAYCQALVELTRGRDLGVAAALDGQTLIGLLPGVPTDKHDRAILAATALRGAINTIQPASTGERAA